MKFISYFVLILFALMAYPVIYAQARGLARSFTHGLACNAKRGVVDPDYVLTPPVHISKSKLDHLALNVDRRMDELLLPRDDGNNYHGRITGLAANASLITESYFSEEVTNYANGWRDPNDIQGTVDFFAPECPVNRRFEYAVQTNIEEWFSETQDDARALRGDFKNIEYTSDKVQAKTINRGLRMVIDLDEVADKANWEQNAVKKIMRRLLRNKLRRAIALLSAAATNTAKTWDTTAGKDPDMDVISEQVLSATASGIAFNRVGYGDTAASKRQLAHRAQNTAGGFASATLTMDALAGLLAVDKVKVSKERYATSLAAKAEILGALVLMFYAEDGADTEDPSNIKCFTSPSQMGGGGRFGVYSRPLGAKLWEIAVEHYELMKITSTLGIRKYTIS